MFASERIKDIKFLVGDLPVPVFIIDSEELLHQLLQILRPLQCLLVQVLDEAGELVPADGQVAVHVGHLEEVEWSFLVREQPVLVFIKISQKKQKNNHFP